MSDIPTTGAVGHVEPTPEAEPLDLDLTPTPPPAAAEAAPSALAASQPPEAPPSGGSSPQEAVAAAAQQLASRLKPVAAVAEGVAAKALDLGSKGLGRLAAILEERRQQRAAGGGRAGTDDPLN